MLSSKSTTTPTAASPEDPAPAAQGSAPRSAQDLFAAIAAAKRFAASFEPGLYTGEDAKKLVYASTELKRVATTILVLSARRVEETHTHCLDGHKKAGSWLAGLTGESVGSAASMLEAARSMEAHPPISEAFRSGRLSEAQAKEIASAADACPGEAENLVEAAENMDFSSLKRHCSDTRSIRGSESEETEQFEQIRSRRYCRIWSDADGSGRLDARVTPDALSVLVACLEPFENEAFEEARKAGRQERHEVYRADALVAMAKASLLRRGPGSTGGSTTGPASTTKKARGDRAPGTTLVRIRVDLEALLRGHRIPGETCEIPGIASVPVKAVREILGDSLLELVLTKGKDVTTVYSDSRYIKKALRIALEERDQTCVVPDCAMSDPLEVNHWTTDYGKGGKTSLDNLARLCPYHHHQKTHRGWRLEGGPGAWRFVRPEPPPDQDHPEDLDDPDPNARSKPPAPKTRNGKSGAKPSRNGSTDGRPGSTNRRGSAKRATGPPAQDKLL